MTHMLFFVLHLLSIHISLKVDGIQTILKEEDLDFERQLKFINKISMKTINTKFGDVIDCIDIYKQPSFHHPLLKHHKLQRKPNFHNMIGESSQKNLRIRSMFGLSKDECPKGTVPILRTTKDDLIREKSMLNNHILTKGVPGVHVVEVSPKPHFGPYYGVRGVNSVYNPRVDTKFQISMSYLWVQNGSIELTNKISLGWHVIPKLYNDYGTHLYSSWTSDNYKKTGCYNIRCAGFVQTSKDHYLGVRITNVSRYGGPTMASLLSITQDPVTKNWWLSVESNFIGYFPMKLFSNMSSADQVGWGGKTRTHLNTPSPQMGSGNYPYDDNFTHACYFKHVLIKGSSRKTHEVKPKETHSFIDRPNCYNVRYPKGYSVYVLLFGGPGGNCGN